MPLPTDTIHWSCKTDAVFEKPMRIPPQNLARDRAINASLALRPTPKSSHDNSQEKGDSFASLSKETFSLPKTTHVYIVRN